MKNRIARFIDLVIYMLGFRKLARKRRIDRMSETEFNAMVVELTKEGRSTYWI